MMKPNNNNNNGGIKMDLCVCFIVKFTGENTLIFNIFNR